jgi:hypothetical protein
MNYSANLRCVTRSGGLSTLVENPDTNVAKSCIYTKLVVQFSHFPAGIVVVKEAMDGYSLFSPGTLLKSDFEKPESTRYSFEGLEISMKLNPGGLLSGVKAVGKISVVDFEVR